MQRRAKPKLFLRGKVWWVWFYDHQGKRIHASTHQRDQALAESAARRIERDHLEAAEKPQISPLDEILAMWLANVERKGRAGATQAYYLAKMKALVRFFGERDVNLLTLADVEAYVDYRREQGCGLAGITKEIKALVSALRYARKHQLYLGDASLVIPDGLHTYTPCERFLSHAEYDAIHQGLPPERRDYLIAYCGLGVRESELYRITPEDLDAERHAVHVRGTKTKRADRWIPLRPEVEDVLMRRAAMTPLGQPLFPVWTNARRDLEAACRRTGIAHVSHNDLRRTFASWLAERGVPELVTASLMGHASSEMVRRVYTRIGPEAQIRAMALLPPLALLPLTGSTVTNGVTEAVRKAGQPGRSGRRAIKTSSQLTVPRAGIEPATRGFSVLCSTN